MNGTTDNVVSKEHEVPLRGRCAHAHLPCKDVGEALPPVAPTDYTVILGTVLAGRTEEEMREEFEALGGLERGFAALLNVLEWVEEVFWRCREIREDGGRLRGQVMALGAAWVGTW